MSKPNVVAAGEQHEARILAEVVDLLAAAVGANYFYDADGAYLIQQPQLKHFAEVENDSPGSQWPRVIYYVHPGDVNITPDTACKMLFESDFLVTAGVKIGGPELPWQTGYVAAPTVQLRIFADLYKAINQVEIEGASIFVTNRNLDLEVEGWAIVQVQCSMQYSEIAGGEP